MTTSIEEIRASILELQQLEDELSFCSVDWRQTETNDINRSFSSSSPTTVMSLHPLVERYKAARDLYVQRRLEVTMIEKLKTFNGETFDFSEFDAHDDND